MSSKLALRVVRDDNMRRVSVYRRSDGHYAYEEDVISEWDDTPPHWMGQGVSGLYPSAKAAMAEAERAIIWMRHPSGTICQSVEVAIPRRQWRPIGVAEHALVMHLLAFEFQGRADILEQAKLLEAMRLGTGYSLALRSKGPPAQVKNDVHPSARPDDCILIEGFYDDVIDEDKVFIRIATLVKLALHLTEGRLSKLDIQKENGKPILNDPYEIALSRVHFY